MTTPLKTRILLVVATMLVAATLSTVHAAELQPLSVGADRLSVTWDVGERRGQQVLEGYVNNTLSFPVANLRVLVDRLDEAGRIVDQRLAWVPGTVGGTTEPVGRTTGPFGVTAKAPSPGGDGAFVVLRVSASCAGRGSRSRAPGGASRPWSGRTAWSRPRAEPRRGRGGRPAR